MQSNDQCNTQVERRRASDGATGTPEQVWELLTQLRDSITAIATTQAQQTTAFIKNDLGTPDYDGHRKAHIAAVEAAKVVEGYKQDATKKIIVSFITWLSGVLALGLFEYFRKGLL